MMEKISRKGFLKVAAAAAMSGVTAAGLAACNAASSASGVSSATGIYTPGTYTATAKGMSEITATVTFDANTITKVELDLSGETESIGVAAKDKLIEQIMNAQTSQIDGVTGATVTSKAVQNAVADCIQQASGGAINPAQQSTEETSSTADWLGEAPEIAESDIKQTVDCEVLVVGAGSSGTFAAAAAAEAGAKTILIEKFGHDMASGIRDTLAACGSKQQQEDGDRVTGLIAKNANDEYVRYNASKGVILACGGYSGNDVMMNALQPQSVEQTCVNYSKPGAKGDGIKACLLK